MQFEGKTYDAQKGHCSDCDLIDEACLDCSLNTHGNIKIWKITLTKTNGGSTPSQYALPPDATELQDVIEYRNMNFAIGNIFKACYRPPKHGNDALYDINKIIFFAEREKARLILLGKDCEKALNTDKVKDS